MKIKKLSKVFTLGIATSLMALSLTACGGNEADVKTAKEPISASKAFNQEGIWFELYEDETVGKDKGIDSILIFDGKGNVTSYECSELTFSDLKELSDDEIITLAKEQDKAVFNAKVSSVEESLNEDKASALDTNTIEGLTTEMNEAKALQPDKSSEIEEFYNSEIDSLKEKAQEKIDHADTFLEYLSSVKYKEPEAIPYTLHIKTDSTGNTTQTEFATFEKSVFEFYGSFPEGNPSDDYWDINDTWFSQEHEIALFPDYGTQTVYDMNFRGFSSIVTLVNEDHAGFTLDTPDTKGIEVD